MNRYIKIKDFHGERSKGVGSSDIPALAGLYRNFGSTTLKLWEQKTGRAEPWAGNQRTEWGNKLEGLVLREFIANRYGEDAADDFYRMKRRGQSSGPFKTETEARHPERRYCLAHADLVVVPDSAQPKQEICPNCDGSSAVCGASPVACCPECEHGWNFDPFIVEAKTTGMMSGKRREGQIFTGYDPDDLTEQGIPDAVFLQVQWQMYVYDVKTAWVAVLIDTADYREYGPIIADPRVQEKCLALAERFWNLVQADTPPAPETWDDVQALFPHQTDTTAMISGDQEYQVREMIARDKQIAERIKSMTDERDDIKNAIGILLGGNSVLASGSGDILAKSSEQSRESVTLLARAKEIAKAQGKKNPPELTPEDIQILALAESARALDLVSVSSFRTVRY